MKQKQKNQRTFTRTFGRTFGAAAVLAGASALSGCTADIYVQDCVAVPHEPVGVYSVTGDEAVALYWIPVTEESVYEFVVYRSAHADGPYHEVGHTPKDYFVDYSAVNGRTYFYAVTALNACGDESVLSRELVFDTPRPEGADAELHDANGDDWFRSGWDFSRYRSVAWDNLDADVFFVWSDGIPFLVATDLYTDIQDAGFGHFDDVSWAPESGWSPTGTVEVIPGHVYVVWTRDNHFAKVRVVDLDGDCVVFDWGYQVAIGNPELSRTPRTTSTSVSVRSGSRSQTQDRTHSADGTTL